MLAKVGNLLGFIWSSPMSVWFWLIVPILKVTGQIQKFEFRSDFKFLWDLTNDGWFCKTFFSSRGWGGFGLGNNIIVIDSNTARWQRTVKHEARHCFQQYICGVLFFPLYILISVWIYIFHRKLHSYYDNPFELAARKAAGQPVKIPKEKWKDGPKDRWAFW